MPSKRNVVLVVGTTPDYIEWIRRAAPGEALFMTDPAVWQGAKEPRPGPEEELRCDLVDHLSASAFLAQHLARWNQQLNGIACFDCESMLLAADLAREYGLPYPSPQAVRHCRDKYRSKLIWQENGIPCPAVRSVRSGDDVVQFLKDLDGPLVIKPLCGTGSELIFHCTTPGECEIAWQRVKGGLESRRSNRIYLFDAPVEELIIAEELVRGEEYSCDVILDGGYLEPIRLTRKLAGKNRPFGTTEGYVLCDAPPAGITRNAFLETLRSAIEALGIHRGICMLDFIVRGHEMVLLEIAPRPGGDCLPFLLRQAYGLDILRLNLDFARQRTIAPIKGAGHAGVYLGIRLVARQGGRLQRISTDALKDDPRVLEIGLTKEPGHFITLPPADYNSWVLGYIIARIPSAANAETDLAGLIELAKVEVTSCC